MDAFTMFHYGPLVIAVCSLGALTVAGALLICCWMSVKTPPKL